MFILSEYSIFFIIVLIPETRKTTIFDRRQCDAFDTYWYLLNNFVITRENININIKRFPSSIYI